LFFLAFCFLSATSALTVFNLEAPDFDYCWPAVRFLIASFNAASLSSGVIFESAVTVASPPIFYSSAAAVALVSVLSVTWTASSFFFFLSFFFLFFSFFLGSTDSLDSSCFLLSAVTSGVGCAGVIPP
jgi:hypothetical protein